MNKKEFSERIIGDFKSIIYSSLQLYLTHKSSYGLPNMCNWKGYKTLFADQVTYVTEFDNAMLPHTQFYNFEAPLLNVGV